MFGSTVSLLPTNLQVVNIQRCETCVPSTSGLSETACLPIVLAGYLGELWTSEQTGLTNASLEESVHM